MCHSYKKVGDSCKMHMLPYEIWYYLLPLVPDTANESNFGFGQPGLALGLSAIGGIYLGSSSITRTCINDDTNFNMFSPTKQMRTS